MPNLSIHHLSNCISSNKSISAHLTWIPHQCSCKFPANVSVNLTLCIHGRMVTGIISQAATCLKEHLSWKFIFPVNGRACWARQGQQMDSLVKIERTEARTVIFASYHLSLVKLCQHFTNIWNDGWRQAELFWSLSGTMQCCEKLLAKKTTPQIWATVLLWVKWDHLTVGCWVHEHRELEGQVTRSHLKGW